jgi:hypothetical protein
MLDRRLILLRSICGLKPPMKRKKTLLRGHKWPLFHVCRAYASEFSGLSALFHKEDSSCMAFARRARFLLAKRFAVGVSALTACVDVTEATG